LSGRRYYYTDPLAAAWMAKHFGMRYNYESLAAWKEGTQGTGIAETWMEADGSVKTDFEYTQPIYIHPDSFPLLEPRPGDVLLRYNRKTFRSHYKAVNAGIRFRPCQDDIIVRRNGIIFMWPASEV
jgi:hypothetical protein